MVKSISVVVKLQKDISDKLKSMGQKKAPSRRGGRGESEENKQEQAKKGEAKYKVPAWIFFA